MAISSTPTGYSNGCTGRLAAAITTTTSTGITVTADTVKSPAGTGAVTWTTGNQIWKISRKTRTNTEVEYIGVESLSQSGTAITTGTVIRYLSPTDGTSFATVGNGLSFPAGSVVELVWDVRHAEQTVFKNNTQTFTGDNTFSGAITMSGTTKTLQVAQMTTTQRDAVASPANGMIIYNTSTGVMNQYIGGAWTTFATGTTADATTTASGKVEVGVAADNAASTGAGDSGALVVVPTSLVVKTSSGAGDENKLPVLNSSGQLAAGFVDLTVATRGIFGNASDGNVTLSGDTNLTRDMYYDTLALSTFTLNTLGYRVYARSITGSGKIKAPTGTAGGNAAAQVGGSLGAGGVGVTVPSGIAGIAGTSGASNTAAVTGAAGTASTNSFGSTASVAGSAGGRSNPTATVPAGGAAGTLTNNGAVKDLFCGMMMSRTTASGIAALSGVAGSGGAAAGSSESVGGGNFGGGGGGGGGGGCPVFVASKAIAGTWTIESLGGAGGTGATAPDANCGGGGGGTGGPGGWAVLIYSSSTWSGSFTLTGGAGGAAGSANGGSSSAGVVGSTGATGISTTIAIS